MDDVTNQLEKMSKDDLAALAKAVVSVLGNGKTQKQSLKLRTPVRGLLIDEEIDDYIAGYQSVGLPLPSIQTAAEEMMGEIIKRLDASNSSLPKEKKIALPTRLPASALAKYLVASGNVAMLMLGDEQYTLAIRPETGRNAEAWEIIYNAVRERNTLREQIEKANPEANRPYLEDVIRKVENMAPLRVPTKKGYLIACENGVVDVRTKTLIPYEQCRDLTFVYKIPVKYNPQATNPIIYNAEDGTYWDVETWMSEVGVIPEITALLWQVIAACVRPYAKWDQCVFLYGTEGNNGKGTLLTLLRALCGEWNTMSMEVNKFDDRFALQDLPKKTLIITDENPDGAHVDGTSNFKACVTNDPYYTDVKYSAPITAKWNGVMVQCINSLFTCDSKSRSFLRRFLPVPLNACFTGLERKYIKHDYVKRPEVLEYVLKKVVDMGFFETFYNPPACEELRKQFKWYNDDLAFFMEDMENEFQWNMLPYDFLYDLYISYKYGDSKPVKAITQTKFTQRIKEWAKESKVWMVPTQEKMTPSNRMDRPEPLILEYNLKRWLNPLYRGEDWARRCCPPLKVAYRCLVRRSDYISKDANYAGNAQDTNS